MSASTLRPAASRAAQAPVAPANSDRFWWGAMAVLMVGIVARQLLLGQAPFHPDEAIHAFYGQNIGSYHYDPVYHGPLLYHLVGAVFGLFGEHDFTARLVPSLLGIGLIALILFPMRRFVSNRAALAGAALVAISPSIITYSRHLLHDSLVLVLTLSAILCFAQALNSPSDVPAGRNARIGLAALLSLFLATKANFFFILVMLIAFGLAWRANLWLRPPAPRPPKSGERAWPAQLVHLVPAGCFVVVTAVAIVVPGYDTTTGKIVAQPHHFFSAVAIATCGIFWLWLMSRPIAEAEPHRENNAAKHLPTAPPIAAARAGAKSGAKGKGKAKTKSAPVAVAAPAPAVVAAPEVAIVKDANAAWLTYALAAAAALWIYIFLFGNVSQVLDQWITNRSFPSATAAAGRESAATALSKMWEYWGGQQQTPRLPGRHDYYVVLALLYEVPILLAAAGGIWHAAKNRSAFTDLLLWWAFTSWAVYAVANEKVPWLIVHICLPLALLGGVWLGQLRLPRAAWIAGLALGAFFSLRTDVALIFGRAGDNAEPILYAQTPEVFRDSVGQMLTETRGNNGILWMHDKRQWPSVWYFRQSAPDVGASAYAFSGQRQLDPILARAGVADPDDLPAVGAMTSAGWQMQTVTFLIWPRASWTAIQPKRYWRWFWTRATFPLAERKLPQTQWDTSILAGQGEWSSVDAVVGWRKN